MKYDPALVEKKWQAFWRDKHTFKAKEDTTKQKYYVLDMFPYPSGAGLHVGHLIGYTATDILARYKWARGFAVLHPMGWDSFGLPAEQYAIRTGTHPAITTQINVKKFKTQLGAVGFAYDWDREIMTSDPHYYKWTQWIFTLLYEKGLAYQADLSVNWCPALGTVLANEEVENGFSKDGGHPVEKRPLRQWVLKITAYADRLLDDLELVDWPEGLKKLQINWIGRSVGLLIDFPLVKRNEKISVFTTAPHTIFGATYVVLSPDHPLALEIVEPPYKEAVVDYQKRISHHGKEKTGVFTGSFAVNPLNGQRVPIWIADYVLMGYGTGAIMGVPAHDERDREFAEEYSLPIIPVVDDNGVCINSSSRELDLNSLTIDEAKTRVIDFVEKKGIGKKTVHYKLRDWLFSRQRYWGEPIPILHFEDGTMRALELDELPLMPPEVVEFTPSPSGESPLAKVKEWVEIVDPKTNKPAKRETNTMPQWAGSCWYYLRFCDPRNEAEAFNAEKEQYWMPVDMYVGGAEHAVLHLLYARFWHKVLYDYGFVSTLEPFQHLVNQGLVVARSFKKKNGFYVAPSDVVEREGAFFHWETQEELRGQIEKMSKSKLNGVSPDEIIEEYGADALRLYSMFMGPIDKEKIWHTASVSGCRRFLNRFFEMVTSDKVMDKYAEGGMRLAHRLVSEANNDIENMLFNVIIAKMMEFLNDFTKLDFYPIQAVKMALQVLAPFAPHLAEELWEYLGEKPSITHYPWPTVDPKYLVDENVTYIIQVNGRVRGSLELPKNQPEERIVELARKDPHVAKFLTGAIDKVVFVPNKLLNLVVK